MRTRAGRTVLPLSRIIVAFWAAAIVSARIQAEELGSGTRHTYRRLSVRLTKIVDTKRICLVFAKRIETKMRLTIVTVLAVSMTSAIAAEAPAASRHHHTGVQKRAVPCDKLRDSNAYAEPAVQPYSPDYSEGAMTSGIAGH